MNEEHETALRLAKDALVFIQTFDARSIVRSDRLGDAFDFAKAEDSALKIIELFRQVDTESLVGLPTSTLQSLHSISDATKQLFQQCLEFDPTTSASATSTRESIILSINNHVANVFNSLSHIISYLGSQQVGARSAIDSLLRELGETKGQLEALLRDADAARLQTVSILETARMTSGAVGAREEASFFGSEAAIHRAASENWKHATLAAAACLLSYAVGTAFLHKWSWFMPTTNIGLVQFIVSKILIFGVLGYLLALSAKNFLNHKHNEIVNKHRENALLTYEKMVNAGQTDEARNIVLQLAAASVYQLHDTGYVKSSEGSGRGGIIEILPKTSLPLNTGGAT